MPLLLKIVDDQWSPVEADNNHSVYSDIMSCSFTRGEDGAEAIAYVKDDIKTAMLPGYAEHEKRIWFTGTAYLMNERGKTVSSFTAKASGGSPLRGSRVEGRAG